jgi:flagellar motility protein MotE (MotC chaperone)
MMAMDEKESRSKKIIKDITEGVDDFMKEAEISKDGVKRAVYKKVEELKKARDETNEELKKIREENKETFEKIEHETHRIAKSFKSAFKGFIDAYSEEKKSDPPEEKPKS